MTERDVYIVGKKPFDVFQIWAEGKKVSLKNDNVQAPTKSDTKYKLPDVVEQAIETLQHGDANKGDILILWNHFMPQVKRVARYQWNLGNSDWEDVVQTTFIKVIEKGATLRDAKKFQSWFWAIAKNVYLDVIKKSRREIARSKSLPKKYDLANSPEDDIPSGRDETKQIFDKLQIEECMNKLTDREKEASLLRWDQDLPRNEIAEILHIKENTVKELLRRAKRKLRNCLGEK